MANSGGKTCFDAGKIGFCHCASVLQAQVPKLCADLDLSLLYILILGTYSKFARKINFLALGVYCPAGQSAFRRSRPQLELGAEIDSSRLVDDYACKNQRYPTPPYAGRRTDFWDKNRAIFLERFFGRGISEKHYLSTTLFPLIGCGVDSYINELEHL